jgi:hypothetical protein
VRSPIDLESVFRTCGAERSLLMSFSSSLDYFESMLLAGLTSQGAAEVTILADANAYKACFSELGAVSGPGILYRFAPIRFAIPRGSFHPKLYLLASAVESILVVASANLTLPGFRANAEIAEVLRLDSAGTGDRSAFESYADLLDYLTAIGAGLPRPIVDEITNHSHRIRQTLAIPGAPKRSDGARLIHSGRRPLIDQLTEVVEPQGVSRITAVAPFFDPGSRGIRALLKAFPNARMRIIKRPASNDFDGSALSHYSKRIVVDHLLSVSGKTRSLHAKIYLIECLNGDVWSVSGSPNMTAAAWSFKAGPVGEHVGNLEAAVVRKIERKDVRELLGELEFERAEWKESTYEESPAAELGETPTEIALIEAEVVGHRLVIRAMPGDWCSASLTRSVTVEDRTSRVMATPVQTASSRAEVVLECEPGYQILQADSPALVTLHAAGGRQRFEGQIWLTRPWLLAATSRERRIRNAIGALSGQLFPPSSDLLIYVQAFEEILAAVAIADISSEVNGYKPPPLNPDGISTTEGGNNLIVRKRGDEGATLDPALPAAERFELLTSTNRIGSGALSLLAQVIGTFDRLLMAPPDEALEDEVLDQKQREKAGPLPLASSLKPSKELTLRQLSARDVRELATALERVGELLRDRAATTDMLPLAIPLFEKVMSVLLRIVAQADRNNSEAATTLKNVITALWKDALSQNGIFDGNARGWLIRARLTESGRKSMAELLDSDGERKEKLTVLLGVSLSLLGEGKQSESSTESANSLVAGWQLVAGEPDLSAYVHSSGYATEILNNFVANSFGLTTASQVSVALRTVDPASLPFMKLIARWAPLVALVRAEQADQNTQEFVKQLRLISPRMTEDYLRIRVRPRATLIRFRSNIAVCEACNTSQPANQTFSLRSAEECVYCNNCQRLLIPYDFRSPQAIDLSEQFIATAKRLENPVTNAPDESQAASV